MKQNIEIHDFEKSLNKLIIKASEDSQFRNHLIDSPLNVICKYTGLEPKASHEMKIVVEDQTDDSAIFFNIPARINLTDSKLTETDLELISGAGIGGWLGRNGGRVVNGVIDFFMITPSSVYQMDSHS